MDIEVLKKEAQELQKIASDFTQELTETGTQEGYLEIIATKVPELLSKIVGGLESLAEKISKLEGTPPEGKIPFIMTTEELRRYMDENLPRWIKEVRELSKSEEK
ncbi:MAG: hypothetical protein WC650_00940 [Candidatus Doudnabacteria bacterium]